ncbi:hypothetical protein PATSB16_30320 [Pandoraea thiooxydans]|nr:hypothetical protein PATSB16_30320 [Pandoraea thiooxydans]
MYRQLHRPTTICWHDQHSTRSASFFAICRTRFSPSLLSS